MCTTRLVCLVALTLAGAGQGLRFSPAPRAGAQTSPALQPGISVEMAVTSHAVPVPEADGAEARIVTVTESGELYLGIDRVSVDGLFAAMRTRPHDREQKLYVKADARATFARVSTVLQDGRKALFLEAILLTSQQGRPESGAIVPPMGLELWLSTESATPGATVVELLSGQVETEVRINHRRVAWPAVQSTIETIRRDGGAREVRLKADGRLSFAEVARLIDACRAAGARVTPVDPEI